MHGVSGTVLRTWNTESHLISSTFGEVGLTVSSLQMNKLRSQQIRQLVCPKARRALTIIPHRFCSGLQSHDQQWPWHARTASVYSLPRTPGKQHGSHCSLAYLLIKHFVRASGVLSSKQNSSFLQKKAISSMSKLPISFHCCFLEWGLSWHISPWPSHPLQPS